KPIRMTAAAIAGLLFLRSSTVTKLLQLLLLLAVTIKVFRCKPCLIGFLQGRPFAVENGKPCRIAVSALGHHMLAEYTLELKPETLGGTLGRPIFIVALPFVAAVAKLIENILHEQELRFRGGGFPRNLRPPIDAADLDDAMDGIYAHQRLPPRHL